MKRLLLPLGTVTLLAALGAVLTLSPSPNERRAEQRYGKVIHETVSDYSRIRIRERGDQRSLLFLDADGAEKCQSTVDLANPHRLQLRYTRSLFISLLLRYPQDRVLIVGLGGGGMVRFLNHALPDTRVDVVEIDPVVVDLAASHFGARANATTTIHTEDAFTYLRQPHGPYDAIYMDAFLNPATDSDLETVTQRLKTLTFLKEIRDRLKPDGLVAFNLIESDASTPADLAAIRAAFPAAYLFSVPGTKNLVAIATLAEEQLSKQELSERAADLDERLDLEFSLEDLVRHIRR